MGLIVFLRREGLCPRSRIISNLERQHRTEETSVNESQETDMTQQALELYLANAILSLYFSYLLSSVIVLTILCFFLTI